DILTNEESNETVTEFWKKKIREIVKDPETAEKLTPKGDVFGCKRLCSGTNYYETFNRDNVELVDVSGAGIKQFTQTGLIAEGKEYELDAIICATGFDAMTGSVTRIRITGLGGQTIQEKWAGGPDNYLGMTVSGFPNMFNMAGPGSPSVLATMVTAAEQHAEWISRCMEWMRENGKTRIDAKRVSEVGWVEEVNKAAEGSLRSTCNSWYVGSNVPGKARVFMPYIGGFPSYVERCEVEAKSGYVGFSVTG
ncbi:MAG: cyclohexanone monooxygenase, partial [Rickettsiales bacterium]